MLYQIYDVRDGRVIRSGLNRDRAYVIADRMDTEYGAARYTVRPDRLDAREAAPRSVPVIL